MGDNDTIRLNQGPTRSTKQGYELNELCSMKINGELE